MLGTVGDYGLGNNLKYSSSQSNTPWFSSIVKTVVISESCKLYSGLLKHIVLYLFSI